PGDLLQPLADRRTFCLDVLERIGALLLVEPRGLQYQRDQHAGTVADDDGYDDRGGDRLRAARDREQRDAASDGQRGDADPAEIHVVFAQGFPSSARTTVHRKDRLTASATFLIRGGATRRRRLSSPSGSSCGAAGSDSRSGIAAGAPPGTRSRARPRTSPRARRSAWRADPY